MSTAVETDVLIVGGGPAGSSAALGLLKYSKLKVVVLEQGDLTQLRVGEQVNASIFDLLAYLGIAKDDLDSECFLPTYASLAAWGSSHISSRHSVFSTQIDSYQVNREHFDLYLLGKAAQEGALVFPRTKALEFSQEEGFWLVKVKHETQGDLLFKAKYLVDASGRQSHVGRMTGATLSKSDDLVAVGAFLQFNDERPLETFLETVEQGWWYYATLPHGRVVVSLFTDSSIVKENQLQKPENWIALLSQTHHIRHRANQGEIEDKIWARNAFSHLTSQITQDNFVAVGDAAASFDPISSMGLGFAISSACHAVKAIVDHSTVPDSLSEYHSNIEHIFNDYLATQRQYYAKEQRWKDSEFWRSRSLAKVKGFPIH